MNALKSAPRSATHTVRWGVAGALSLALGLSVVLWADLPARAAIVTYSHQGITYSADDANQTAGATVTGYDVSVGGTDVDILASVPIGGHIYAVTRIGEDAFFGDGLTSVSIPDSVTSIEAYAFQLNDFTSVTIPDSVITIGTGAFQLNQSMVSVSLGNSVTTIGPHAFNANALTAVTIPNSVTIIDVAAFMSNELTSLTLGESVTTIEEWAFYGSELTEVTIPASVTWIGPDVFNFNPLTSIVFEGNAPVVVPAPSTPSTKPSFGPAAGKTLYFCNTATGFTTPTWQGYDTQVIGPHAVTFDSTGGSAVGAQGVDCRGTATAPAAPTRSGYEFAGWFLDSSGTTPYDFAATVTDDLTLFALWEQLASGGGELANSGGEPQPALLATGLLGLLLGTFLLTVRTRARRRSESTLYF